MALTTTPKRRLDEEAAIRARRWRFFQRVFGITCVAISCDVVTTYLGFQRIGARFEQNGLALYIIQHAGWVGLVAFLSLVCYVCLRSFRLVYWRLSPKWSRGLNMLVAVVCVFRWIVVLSNVLWLLQG
jgi:hypothetical protein